MSLDDARRILGVGPDASKQEIQAAYTRLMRLAHPDKGGTVGLASQLNARGGIGCSPNECHPGFAKRRPGPIDASDGQGIETAPPA